MEGQHEQSVFCQDRVSVADIADKKKIKKSYESIFKIKMLSYDGTLCMIEHTIFLGGGFLFKE